MHPVPYPDKCQPLSYDGCRQFAVEFDRLYEGRDKSQYPLSNPMRKERATTLQDMSDNEVFNNVQFPLRYVFLQDASGVVARNFREPSAAGSGLAFSIVNDSNGMALAVRGSCADGQNIELQTYDRSNEKQQFTYDGDGRIFSVACPGKVVSAETESFFRCADGTNLVLRGPSALGLDISITQQWTFNSDGTVGNVGCRSSAITSIQENPSIENDYESTSQNVTFSVVNPSSGLAISLPAGHGCANDVELVVQESDFSPDQLFYFGSDGQIFPSACPNKVLQIR